MTDPIAPVSSTRQARGMRRSAITPHGRRDAGLEQMARAVVSPDQELLVGAAPPGCEALSAAIVLPNPITTGLLRLMLRACRWSSADPSSRPMPATLL